jgi:hypothetical protein
MVTPKCGELINILEDSPRNCVFFFSKANKRRMALVFLFFYFSFSLFEEEA